MKLLRVFIDNNQIVGTYGLEGSGEFPLSVADNLAHYASSAYCIVLDDPAKIDNFLMAGTNTVVNGEIVIGQPGIVPKPPKPRDIAKEMDDLKTALTSKGILP